MALLTGSFLTDFVTISLTLVVILVVYLKWTYTYWERRGIPGPKPLFFFGNTKSLFLREKAIGETLKDMYNEFKAKGAKHCGFYFLMGKSWLVLDPELIKSILTKDFTHFVDHSNYINEETDPLTGQLFMLKGQKWKNMRQKLTPTFTSGKMKMMFPTMLDCSKELMVVMDKIAKAGEAMDVKDVVGRFTTDIIGSCAFGLECNSLKNPDSEFRHYGKKVFETGISDALKNLIITISPTLMDILRIPVFKTDVTRFFINIVNQTIKYREENGVIRKDFMHLLIQLKNNVKVEGDGMGALMDKSSSNKTGGIKSLTTNEIAAQAFVFFLAGFETSSTTLTFCFYELVLNTEIQDKLRQEIVDVISRHGGELTYEALSEMTYMEKCLNETLRKYPPLPMLFRECTEEYTIPNTNQVIEKGIKVFIPTLGIQHDPEHYPDPEKFDPERFSPEIKAQRHPFTWLPFGEGPRVCIGLRFGMMQSKVALALLLRRYKFTLNSKTETPLVMDTQSVIMNTKGGIWLNVEKIA